MKRTPMTRLFHILFLCSLLLLTYTPVSAQVQTGTPPFGSYAGGPDVINLGNLNDHWVIPVLQKAGRGLDFNYSLVYDSSIWYPVVSGGNQTWKNAASTQWGWTTSLAMGGGRAGFKWSHISGQKCSTYQWEYTTYYTGWQYIDGRGTVHPFSGQSTVSTGCTNKQTSFSGAATDGSGYTMSVTGTAINSLYASDGDLINPSTGAINITDRNGNEITSTNSSGTTSYYDTLNGTTPVLTVAGAGTPSSPMTFTYTLPSLKNS